MTWEPSVFSAEDGSQVLVNRNEAGRFHVATRPHAGASWGPPLECIVETRSRREVPETTPCPRCHERPVISLTHQLCAPCILEGVPA